MKITDRDEAWHRITAIVGPILKAAFPEAHSVTRLQAAQAIATEFEHLARPRFGEPGYRPAPVPTHPYRAHKKWPWFCADCGYPEHERLKHPPRDSDRSARQGGETALAGSTEGESAGRSNSEGIAQNDPT